MDDPGGGSSEGEDEGEVGEEESGVMANAGRWRESSRSGSLWRKATSMSACDPKDELEAWMKGTYYFSYAVDVTAPVGKL